MTIIILALIMKKIIGSFIIVILGLTLVYFLLNTGKNTSKIDLVDNDVYEVCDENGNRYVSEDAALESGLSYAQFGATYCPEYLDGQAVKQEDQKKLDGTSWVFGESGMLSFNNGMYSATVGCNTINGAFKEKENRINFEEGMSTLMACADLDEAEKNLKDILLKATDYQRFDNALTITGSDVSLNLLPAIDTTLTDVKWKISSLKEGLGITSTATDTGTFLLFNTDGTFSGKSACNSVMGSYTLDGNMISFSNIGSTKMMCSSEENTREQVLITSLSNVSEYSISGGSLMLASSDQEYVIALTNK